MRAVSIGGFNGRRQVDEALVLDSVTRAKMCDVIEVGWGGDHLGASISSTTST